MTIKSPPVSAIAVSMMERGCGMVACKDGLGVFLAPAANDVDCPAGWVFVAAETATAEGIDEAIAYAKEGRKGWPAKESGSRPR